MKKKVRYHKENPQVYMHKHPSYVAIIHVFVGLGIGIILTNPIFGEHPLRWGLFFLGLGLLGHFYPYYTKK